MHGAKKPFGISVALSERWGLLAGLLPWAYALAEKTRGQTPRSSARMASMPRFSLKDILRGITLASIGFGILAVAFHHPFLPTSKGQMLAQAFLVGFGGMLVGYGFAFPFKYPPHQMILAMVGMFAAESWQTGSWVGLLVYGFL